MRQKLIYLWEMTYFFFVCVPLTAFVYSAITVYFFFKPNKIKLK